MKQPSSWPQPNFRIGTENALMDSKQMITLSSCFVAVLLGRIPAVSRKYYTVQIVLVYNANFALFLMMVTQFLLLYYDPILLDKWFSGAVWQEAR